MFDFQQYKTGDLLVNNSRGKFATTIRFFTISNYNHVTVAVRIDPNYLPKIKIVRTGGAILFLEPSRVKENGQYKREVRINMMDNKKVLRLPLKDQFYSREFENRITELIYQTGNCLELKHKEYIKIQQPENFRPTLNYMSNRIQLTSPILYLCSENVADFYDTILPEHIDKTITPANGFVPQTFLGPVGNPYYNLFESSQIVYDINATDNYWLELLVLILFIIIILILIYMGFRYWRRCKTRFYIS